MLKVVAPAAKGGVVYKEEGRREERDSPSPPCTPLQPIRGKPIKVWQGFPPWV